MSIIRRRSAKCKIRFVYYSINIFYILYPPGDLPVDPVSEAEQIIVGLRFFSGTCTCASVHVPIDFFLWYTVVI